MPRPLPPKPTHPIGALVAHDGRLAQWRYGSLYDERPVYWERIAVSDLPLDGYDQLAELLGRTVGGHGAGGWSGYCRRPHAWNDTFVNTEGWAEVRVETPIPPPRNGKDYTWRWAGSYNGWIRDYYPRCPECRDYHAPGLPHCDECGRGHKKGRCPR